MKKRCKNCRYYEGVARYNADVDAVAVDKYGICRAPRSMVDPTPIHFYEIEGATEAKSCATYRRLKK